jgi:hypothetical protein
MITPDAVDDVETGTADQLLSIFATAFSSGYASAFVHAAERQGYDDDEVLKAGQCAEERAKHLMAGLINDPASRHATLETLRHLLAGCSGGCGRPPHGLHTIHRPDAPLKDKP